MSTGRKVLFVVLVGSIWGMLEVLLWDIWHLLDWPHASTALAIVALFCLAAGRRVLDSPGTSLAIALVACLYKFASVAFFACQMTGVLTLAASFELMAFLTKKSGDSESQLRPYLLGLLTVYPAFIAFALLSTFVIRIPFWAETGWSRILPYLGWGALLATIGSTFSAAIGWRIGKSLLGARALRWRLAVPAAVIIWAMAILHAAGA